MQRVENTITRLEKRIATLEERVEALEKASLLEFTRELQRKEREEREEEEAQEGWRDCTEADIDMYK